jgi:creatinine amidohydrolase
MGNDGGNDMTHIYRQLTWEEAREAASQRKVIVIPVAAIEQHGYHLPIDTDNLAVEYVTEEAARRSNGLILVAPMIHYGFNEHNMGFPGTISIREEVFMDFCYDVGRSFVRQGFDRLLYVNGHGSNQMLCNLVARRLVNTTPALAAAVPYWNFAKESEEKLRESDFPGGMAHGCEFETSIYLFLKPDLVLRDKMVTETPSKISRFIYDDLFGSGPVHFVNRWSRVTTSGVEGDPFKASAEKGKAFVENVIDNIIEFSKDFRALPDLPDRDLNQQAQRNQDTSLK